MLLSKSPWRRSTNRVDDDSSLAEAARELTSKNSLDSSSFNGSNEKSSRVSRACQRLKDIFSARSCSHPENRDGSEDANNSQTRDRALARSSSATALVAGYIRGVTRPDALDKRSRAADAALTRAIARQPSEPRIFLVGQGSSRDRHALLEKCRACRVELVGVACLLVELKKHLCDTPWSSETGIDLIHGTAAEARGEANRPIDNSRLDSERLPIRACDKAVQCPAGSDSLELSPNLKFFSRSSLVINVDQQQQTTTKRVLQQPERMANRALGGKLLPSPSLEYVASYRPEFRRPLNVERLPGLRSFSSSAIFGIEPGAGSSGRLRATYVPNARNWAPQSSRQQRSRRNPRAPRPTLASNPKTGGGDSEQLHLRDALRRTEDELLRYSSFIEDDLVSLPRPRSQPSTSTSRQNSRWPSPRRPPRRPRTRPSSSDRLLAREDVLEVKKILLEDYITEVREIVRSGQRCGGVEGRSSEAAILESVRRRMDEEEPARPLSDDSWHSLKSVKRHRLQIRPSTSGATSGTYATARNCCSECECCCCCCWSCGCGCCGGLAGASGATRGSTPPRESGDFCRYAATERLRRGAGRTRGCGGGGREGAESCCDSYVEAEASSRLANSESESKAKTSRSVDSGVQLDYSRGAGSLRSSDELAKLRGKRRHRSATTTTGDESSGCSDEVLCQRVESAVRKFTEKLILCERRTNDRSSSAGRRRPARRKSYTLTDQNSHSTLNYLRNSLCSSEEELITEISTPSLVSLTDSDNPTSLDVSCP